MLTSAKGSDLILRPRACARFAPLRAVSGQAAIELILILVITIGVVAGLLFRFNKAFASFAKDLLGSYVICLLDNGELPGLGSDSTEIQCAPPQFAFNGSAGTDGPGAGGSSGGSGGGSKNGGSKGGGSGQSGSGSNKDGKKREGTRAADSSRSGAGGTGGGGGARGGGGDPFLKKSRSQARRGSAGGGEAEGENAGGSGALEFRNGAGGFSGVVQRSQRERRVISSFTTADDGSGIDKDRAKKVSLGAREKDELRPNRMRLEASAKKVKQLAEDDSEFTFADLLRYILIAAIIIVLVIFIGGQALSVSKSWEKDG